MRRRTWVGLAVLLALAGLLGVPATAEADSTLVSERGLSPDGRLREVTLHSDALGGQTRVRILLPAGYDDPGAPDRRYPVLLLLHGASGNEGDWSRNSHVEAHTADRDLIVVMPDGGAGGFYSDWLHGPAWESFHIEELLPWVDATYRTVGTRAGRAVAGLSMGGFGAMSYAARHPDLFVAVASFSGALDLTGLGLPEAIALQLVGIAPDSRWGPFLTDEARWRSHNPTDLVVNLRGLAIRHTTGTGVPCEGDRAEAGAIESAVFPMNVSFDLRASQAGVAHEYLPRACGTHEWQWWDADLAAWLPVLMSTFADPPPPPAEFDYRTAEPEVAVWGWSFTAHRPAVEWLDLSSVSPAGLTVTGSGPVDVVTPPVYVPGATYALSTTGAGTLTVPVGLVPSLGPLPPGPASDASVAADETGRLAFTVDLGPAHTANQFSPDGAVAEALALGSYFRTATVEITAVAPGPTAPPATGITAPPPTDGAPPRSPLPATGGGAPVWAGLAALAAAIAGLVARRAAPS